MRNARAYQATSPSRRLAILLGAAVLSFLPVLGVSQTAPGIRTLYVRPADANGSSAAVERQLIHRINKSGSLRVVTDKKTADAVLKIEAVIWPAGTYSPNPRSKTAVVGEYQGYASADLTSRTDQPLWSYLATPSRLHFAGVADDLAGQIYDSLRLALKNGSVSPASASALRAGTGAPLRVAGATFPAPLYRRWFESYAEQAGGATIPYDATGSVAGLDMLRAGKIDMAASDIPDQSGAAADVLLFPTVVGGVVPIFNLPGLSRDLYLTPQLLADIYAGKIKKWNDPHIRGWNRDARLPDADIQVVHRSDGSGTTFVWTSFLASASADWKEKAGASPDWPLGIGARGNDGVAAKVQTTRNAIGYVELTYAIQHQLSYASVRNPAGQFVHADLNSIMAAAQNAGVAGGMSLLNGAGANTYPVATFTYFVVPRTGEAGQTRAAISQFLRWMLTSGQKQCASLGYAPLPRAVVDAEMKELDTVK